MAFLNNLVSQLSQVIARQSPARRVVLALAMVGTLGGLVWLMLSTSSGGWVPILTQSDLSETGAAMAKLSQLQIPTRTESNGTTLLVARDRQDEAVMLLAMEGIYDRGTMGNELLDRNSFGDSKFKQEKNYLRVREGELARTLMSLSEVENARVHLALPEQELFVSDQKPPKASVVLKLRPGRRLNERQINGIVNLVSHSIEGLEPDNVSIIDSAGNMLNQRSPSSFANITAENLNFKLQAEERLRNEIEKMLERTVGRGRVVASVQMEYDFSQQKSVATIFNPNEQDPILRTDRQTVEQQVIAGEIANDPDTQVDTTPPGTMRNESTRDYAVSQRVEEKSVLLPTLERVTVGVMVDGTYVETVDPDGNLTREFRPRSPQELAELERIVRAAIGFNNETRQDVVELTCVPFQIEEQDVMSAGWFTPEMRELTQMGIQWGVIAFIGLLLILLVLRPAVGRIMVTPVPAEDNEALPGGASEGRITLPGVSPEEGGEEGALDEAAIERLAQMGQLDQSQLARLRLLQQSNKAMSASSQRIFSEIQEEVKNNPERTVGLIRQWMEEG